ncbi:MAG: hypothetical protein KF800_07695 [Lysobacter sp.]|nr:hypothetical protein [Lysobacter sp.]
MIANEQLASDVSRRIIEINRLLNELATIVVSQAPSDEERLFRQAIGAVSGELLLSIANPLYRQHPTLKPPELD